MPLIVEDGTAKEDANSYVDLTDARAIADSRGISLNADDDLLSQELVSSADRLNTYESRFSGSRVDVDQGLSYPRSGSIRFGSTFPADKIPKELKLAQVMLAGILNAGGEIWSSEYGGISREKIGPLEVQYTDDAANSVGNPELPQIDSVLQPILGAGNAAPFNFRVTR